MDTWLWVIGGIIVVMLCFVLFLKIFSGIHEQTYVQGSLEAFSEIAGEANRMCSTAEERSLERTIKLSTLVNGIFASGEDIMGQGERTYGDKLCINISGQVSCEELGCEIEAEPFINELKVLGLLDKLRGNMKYREYVLKIEKSNCGVSILNPDSDNGCVCGSESMDIPIYYDYNGWQPVLFYKEKSVVLADTYLLSNPVPETGILLENIASHLGGSNIILIFEENLTDPNISGLSSYLLSLHAKGYSIDMLKHYYSLSPSDYEAYDQIWLMTPGFCKTPGRNCTDTSDWMRKEIFGIISAHEDGKGIFLVTDSGVRTGIYEAMNLDEINRLLHGMGYPIKQIQSCVGMCVEGVEVFAESLESPLTLGLESFRANAIAVFDEHCSFY